MATTLEEARTAIQRHDWALASAALTDADRDRGLSPDDLLLMADAYWWTAQPDEALETFERAYAELVQDDREAEAATVGALLAYLAIRRMAFSVATGWMARVERLLEGQPESVGHAWLKILYIAKAYFMDDDQDTALALADEALELGQRHRDPAVQALAMSFKGYAMIARGDWRDGMALIDEATVVAMSGDTNLRAAADVYCATISACRDLADYRRAGEWTEQAERWMRTNSVGGYTGVCQVHRAEIKRLRGSWSEAEKEARRACVELERFHLMDGVGYAYYEIGEVRRRMGDLDAAEDAFKRSYEYGVEAQPGRSLLMMDRGDVEGAAKSIKASLDRTGRSDKGGSATSLSSGRMLPAQVEIALAAGDFETARAAVNDLEEIAGIYEGLTWEASAVSCRGSLQLREGSPEDAIDSLDRAWRLWQELDMPYESALARVLLGEAHAAVGDNMATEMEFGAAKSTFQRLGASRDLQRLATTSGRRGEPTQVDGHRVTKAFMFTDIVTSTDLIGLIGDKAWEELLAWHDRALRAAIQSTGGEEVRHTGDGFFVTFDDARSALDCAVKIQRRLDEHRRDHGFAPLVRIGMHLTEATRQGSDYSGQGVHVAARVGDLGEGEQIIASGPLLEAAGAIPYPTSEGRNVDLKGIADPLTVHTLEWR